MAATFEAPVWPLVIQANITDAATADYDYTLTRGILVFDALATKIVADAAAANTVQLQTGGGAAITDVMNGNIVDTTNVRAGTVNDATNAIQVGAALRVAIAKAGGNAAYAVTVYCLPG